MEMSKMNVDSDYDLRFNHELEDRCEYVETDIPQLPVNDKQPCLSVMQLNIRGLLGKQESVTRLLKRINKSNRIDVILLVETWLKKSTVKHINIPGYTFTGSHREGKKKGGGVGILIQNSLQWRERKDLTHHIPNFENKSIEIKTHNNSIILSSLYRPPNSPEKEFLKNYKKFLSKFTQHEQDRLIIGTDHNMDFLKQDLHLPTKDFIDLNLDYGLLPTVTKPTRITRNTATLIDNIIVGKNFYTFQNTQIWIDDISDHLPILITIPNIDIYKKIPTKVTTRAINDQKIKQIKEELNEQDWTNLQTMDLNDAYELFQQTLQTVLDKIAPIKTFTISGKKKIKEEWMTPGILKSLKRQKLLYSNTLKQRCNDQVHNKYKEYRNKLKQIIRKRKETCYNTKCVEFKRNSKKLWDMINRISHNERDKTNLIECLKIENIMDYNAKNIASEFGKYFSSIGKTLANQIPTSNHNINTYINNIIPNPNTIYIQPTTKQEVERLIDGLKNKNSSGYDDITNNLLKGIKTAISTPLEILFNMSLSTGEFPDLMKLGDVIPLYKAKEKYLTTNYRPISLLTTTSKILEKLMYKRTYNFLIETNQLYPGQYGFRSNHSTEHAISELIGNIAKGFENNKYTIGIFLDLSKAFDTLSHSILLQKMEKYGIRGHALAWFASYLRNRKMRSKCIPESTGKIEYSNYYQVEYGTLQGSCLGPLLFIIFTNDFHLTIKHANSLLFADDTTLYQCHRKLSYLKWIMEEELKSTMDWFRANQLTLNLSKTVCILFSPNPKITNIELNLDTMHLNSVDNTKFLGMWVDKQLNWKKHMSIVLTKFKAKLKYA